MLTIPAAMRRPCLPDAAHRPPAALGELADDGLSSAPPSNGNPQEEFVDILQVQRLLLDTADRSDRSRLEAGDKEAPEGVAEHPAATSATTPTSLREAFLLASGLHSTSVTTTAPSGPPSGRVLQRQLGVLPGHYNVHYPVEDLFALWLNSTSGKQMKRYGLIVAPKRAQFFK